MIQKLLSLPNVKVSVDPDQNLGPYEWWRHTIGHGGVNSLPLPEKVVQGAQKLKPRLLRTFIQEFFNIYPDHGTFDWSKLDPYMDALHRTGADIVACITIKPPVLYPVVDHSIWKPKSIKEWQSVIFELVKRYSIERNIVTYWEIGNETDIGEHGACPYLIKEAEDYLEYYKFTTEPILKAFPAAKIGGPAIANGEDKLFYDFIDLCHETGTKLDFVSWHLYHDDPQRHKHLVVKAKNYLDKFKDQRPEMLVTEWSKGFEKISIEELAMQPRTAASTAASIMEMMEAGLDWSFYYHIWDQTFYPEEFSSFYKDMSIMTVHWNEMPHRFGMFGVSEEARPQYFVYLMLSRMGEQWVQSESEDTDLRVHAATNTKGELSLMISNFNVRNSEDKITTLWIKRLAPGPKRLLTYRIDDQLRWNEGELELKPYEDRIIDTVNR